MKSFLGKLRQMLFSDKKYKAHVDRIKEKNIILDKRIDGLEQKATFNGDEGWFLDKVRKDPTCALKVLRECDNDNA